MAGVRVGLTHDGEYLVNPTTEELEDSQMDLIVAGTESAVLMIEGYCDFLTEEQVLEVSCWPKQPTQRLRGESLILAPCCGGTMMLLYMHGMVQACQWLRGAATS